MHMRPQALPARLRGSYALHPRLAVNLVRMPLASAASSAPAFIRLLQLAQAVPPSSIDLEIAPLIRKSARVLAGISYSGALSRRDRRADAFRPSLLEKQQRRLGALCVGPCACFDCKVTLKCGMADKPGKRGWPVYLYIPNIIVSIFGAVLDMVTDRVSTACLLVVLFSILQIILWFFLIATCFRYCKPLVTDVQSVSFSFHTGSTFLSSKSSHKDVKNSTSWLLRTYYGHRLFMGYCCVGSEILYIILFLLSSSQSESVIDVLVNAMRQKLLFSFPILVALAGWAIKQMVNVIQMKTAADVCVVSYLNRRERP